MSKITLGIDVGGTIVKLGLVNSKGTIIARGFLDTKKYIKNKQKLINTIIGAAFELLYSANIKRKNVTGMCFGLPGLIDPSKGIVHLLPNIPGWKNVQLKKIVQKATGIKTYIENDVNLITLGEWKYGAGKGYKNMICMTLGTGVGAGLILNDSLYRGEGFVAGELGHMPLNEKGSDCNCGGVGCFERVVGNNIIREKAAKLFKNKNIQLEDVYYLAEQGNDRAVQFWEEVAQHIGNGLVGPINLLNPRAVVIGGGVSKSYKYLRKTIKEVVKKRAMKVQGDMVKIVRAKLGDDAGIIGSQVLVRN